MTNWNLTPTSFAYTTDKELIMKINETTSLEVAYFTNLNKYGYSFIILGKDGFVDKSSEDFADTVEELMELIKKDELIEPYLDEITAPTEAEAEELKKEQKSENEHEQSLFKNAKDSIEKLKQELRKEHQNAYFDTPQTACYNPNPLLNAISKVENALYDLEANYGCLLEK